MARNSACRNGSDMETREHTRERHAYSPIFRPVYRCRMQSGYAGCTYIYARHVIHNTRAHPYTVCGGENTIEKSRCSRRDGGGLSARTVRRLQGYPASLALAISGNYSPRSRTPGKRIVKDRRPALHHDRRRVAALFRKSEQRERTIITPDF